MLLKKDADDKKRERMLFQLCFTEKLAKEAGDAGAELLNLCANPPPLLRSRSPPG